MSIYIINTGLLNASKCFLILNNEIQMFANVCCYCEDFIWDHKKELKRFLDGGWGNFIGVVYLSQS